MLSGIAGVKVGPRAGPVLWHLQQVLRPGAAAAVGACGGRSFGRHPKHDPRIINADKPMPRWELPLLLLPPPSRWCMLAAASCYQHVLQLCLVCADMGFQFLLSRLFTMMLSISRSTRHLTALAGAASRS